MTIPVAVAPVVPDDLLPVAEAAALVRSPRPGRDGRHRTSLGTLYRWIAEGRLRGYRRLGRWLMVSRGELLSLVAAVPVRPRALARPTPGQIAQGRRRSAAVLDAEGV
jgi:hypothetical protein